jgi:hypothetical protein
MRLAGLRRGHAPRLIGLDKTAADHRNGHHSGHDRICWRCWLRAALGRTPKTVRPTGCTEACSEMHTYSWPCEASRDTGTALLGTLLLGLVLTSLLGLAFLAGEQRRCDSLREQGSALVERYCGTEAGR